MNTLWAKDTGETIFEHTANVVGTANKICSGLPFPDNERKQLSVALSLLAVFHDLGKAATGFQNSLRHKKGWGHRHEIISTAIANILVPEIPKEALFAILTHHRSIPESITTKREKCLPLNELPFDGDTPAWDQMIMECLQNWDALRELLLCFTKLCPLDIPAYLRFNGLGLPEIVLHRVHQKKMAGFNRRNASLLRGLLVSADHIASAHQFDLPIVPVQNDFRPVIYHHELKDQNILPFQERCAETEGDAILKAPTGSGKTAAILLWAVKNQVSNGRLFYVLPHTASINAMYRRLQKIYGEIAVGVLHHKNAASLYHMFESDYPSIEAAKLAKTISALARELYHPIRVTTPHQILRVALQGKGWELGLAEFPNACFIFDEIHAFEPLLTGLTIATVKWLKTMGAKVLFASATLPSFLESILKTECCIDYGQVICPDPGNAADKAVLNKLRHKVEIRQGSLLANIDAVIHEIKASDKTALIICNHVATSQIVWARLNAVFDGVLLLHARFNAEDRFRIESAIQGKKPPRILVATQAVEVSLDLDYESGYIEPAPADALGQRLGRINRKGSRPPAPVVIFKEPSAVSKGRPLYLPYDKEVTEKTVSLLGDIRFLTEKILTEIVNDIYEGGYHGEAKNDYDKGLKNQTIANFDENIIAGTYRDWVENVIEGTDGQFEVLPMNLYERYVDLKKAGRYLEARLLLVPVQSRQINKLYREGVLSWDNDIDEYRTTLQYSSKSGLSLSQQEENIF